MFAISFVGVTPGFTKRDIWGSEEIAPFVEHCSDMAILEQFDISIPKGGYIYVVGTRKVRMSKVRFIGLFEFAQELGGHRSGGYCGVGIWTVDGKINIAKSVTILADMQKFLSAAILGENRRVIRTFESVDWVKADEFIRSVALAIEADIVGDYGAVILPFNKFLLVWDDKGVDGSHSIEFTRVLENLHRVAAAVFNDRIIYATGDERTIGETGKLGRLRLIDVDELIRTIKEENKRKKGRDDGRSVKSNTILSSAERSRTGIRRLELIDYPADRKKNRKGLSKASQRSLVKNWVPDVFSVRSHLPVFEINWIRLSTVMVIIVFICMFGLFIISLKDINGVAWWGQRDKGHIVDRSSASKNGDDMGGDIRGRLKEGLKEGGLGGREIDRNKGKDKDIGLAVSVGKVMSCLEEVYLVKYNKGVSDGIGLQIGIDELRALGDKIMKKDAPRFRGEKGLSASERKLIYELTQREIDVQQCMKKEQKD